VTISKIRFLEDQGLVQPDRTPSGYRKFSASDVSRLQFVLTQQRDHYLPLRVIKDQLESIDAGRHGHAHAPGTLPRPPLSQVSDRTVDRDSFSAGPATLRLTREELLNTAGLRPEQLTELEQFGLVKVRPDGLFDDDTLAVCKIVGDLARFGIEGRHLRSFKAAAEREVGLFAQIAGPLAKQRNGDGRARAEETIRELSGLSVRLHSALVQIGLRSIIG
jgi:DNA-binding transcriptional MerR regulator